MKTCTKCKIKYELNIFSKDISKKDLLDSICKNCRKVYNINNKNNRKLYNKENKEKIAIYYRKYSKDNIKFKKYKRNYFLSKYKNNINFRISCLLRKRFYNSINKNKSKSVIELLGCTIEECKLYLEQQFKPEFTWENHGLIWEIDHIKPCSKFDLTKEEEQKQCFHYTNLQPLFKTTEIAESFGYKDQIGNRNKYNNI